MEADRMSVATPFTADQLQRMPDDGNRYELLAGELKMMAPPGWEHGAVGWRLSMILGRFVEDNGLGRMFLAETGFLIAHDPDTVRAPDIAFIHSDHLPDEDPQDTYWPGAPDLAVEVVSPSDTVGEVGEKVRAWLDAGTLAVWVVDPRAQTITVYRSPTDVKILTVKDELTGGDVVPGFLCAVAEVFAMR